MGVFCQILINKPKDGVYKAGSLVTGIVRYTLDEPKKYKDIIISLIGKGKCEWTERRNKKSYHYSGKEVYVKEHLCLHEKGSAEDFILSPGTFEHPFTFTLPNNIPSSYKDNTCKIKYKIVIKFVKPNFFSVNKKFEIEIKVIGFVHPLTTEGNAVVELDKILFTPFKKKKHHIHLQTEISNNIIKPGENVQVSYRISNDTDVIIPSVKAELTCRTIYTADYGRKKKIHETISQCTVETPSVPDNAIADLMNVMSIADHVYTIQNTKVMSNEYRIKVTLRLPMPYINSSIKIPIVIGKKYGVDEEELHVPESEDVEEEPPSYFEAMNECKKEKE